MVLKAENGASVAEIKGPMAGRAIRSKGMTS